VAGGATILLTTQYLEEADELADQVALLDQGRLIAEGIPEELKRLVGGGHVRLAFVDAGTLEHAAKALGVVASHDEALALQVPSDGSVRSLRALLDQLDHDAIEVGELSVHTPDLDDVFLALTGHAKEKEPEAP
jgi:ABC-2 type transport system ATP-binding protein